MLGDDGVLDVLSLLGGGEFFYRSELTKLFGEFGCADDVDLVDLCGNVLFLISGYDHSNLNDVSQYVYPISIPLSIPLYLSWKCFNVPLFHSHTCTFIHNHNRVVSLCITHTYQRELQ